AGGSPYACEKITRLRLARRGPAQAGCEPRAGSGRDGWDCEASRERVSDNLPATRRARRTAARIHGRRRPPGAVRRLRCGDLHGRHRVFEPGRPARCQDGESQPGVRRTAGTGCLAGPPWTSSRCRSGASTFGRRRARRCCRGVGSCSLRSPRAYDSAARREHRRERAGSGILDRDAGGDGIGGGFTAGDAGVEVRAHKRHTRGQPFEFWKPSSIENAQHARRGANGHSGAVARRRRATRPQFFCRRKRRSGISRGARAQPSPGEVYFNYLQRPQDRMALVVRTDQDAHPTSEDVVEPAAAQRWLNMMMVTVVAGIALLLASVGVYGVVAYGVNERRREFGIRLALGAERGAVARLVVWQGTVLAILGSAIGFLAAVFVAKAIESLLYGLRASDPPSFATAVGLLVSVALFARYMPARRAASVDPAITLRSE